MDDTNVILTVGYKIDIEIPNESEQESPKILKSQIIDIIDDDTYAIAAPFYKGNFYNLHKNAVYKFLFGYDDKGLFYFTGAVTDRGQHLEAPYFIIKKISPFHRHQRRYFYRLRRVKQIQYKEISTNPRDALLNERSPYKTGLTKDISGSGMCIVLDENIDAGKKLEVILTLECESIVLECVVIRSAVKLYGSVKKYEIGLFYDNITEKERYKIVKYIFEQQRLLIREQKKQLELKNEIS